MARQIGAKPGYRPYAVSTEEQSARWELWRARDDSKDQSYFCGTDLQDNCAQRIPGAITSKDEVATSGTAGELPCDKPESMELCVVPMANSRSIIEAYSRACAARFSKKRWAK